MQRCRVDHATRADEPPLRRHRGASSRSVTPPRSTSAASPTTAAASCPGTCSAACPAGSATVTPTPPRRSSGARSGCCASTSSPSCSIGHVVQTRVAPGTMRPVMARLAAAFYGYPARDLLMIGVTGTNGKTTVTQLLGDLLEATGTTDQRDGHAVGRADDAGGHRGAARPGPRARPADAPTAAATPSPWRCRATRWCSRGSRASTSTWPSSPT